MSESRIISRYLDGTYNLENAAGFLWVHEPETARALAGADLAEVAVFQEGLRFSAIDRFYTQDLWLNTTQVVRLRTALRGVPSAEITPESVLEILGFKTSKVRARFLARAAAQPRWASPAA